MTATLDTYTLGGRLRRAARSSPLLGVLVACGALLAAGGCGVPASSWHFNRDLLAADALADDGRHAEAEAAYSALLPRSTRDDITSELRFRVAQMLERQGERERALDAYLAIARTPRNLYDHTAGSAFLRAAHLVRDGGAGPDAFAAILQGVVETFPNTFAADDALGDLIALRRGQGNARALLGFLTSRYVPLQRTEVADNLAYWTGRVLQEDLGEIRAAIEVYAILITQFHPSGLTDDALWRTATCHRQLGEIDAEYRLLKAFVDTREVSWIMADYESSYYKPALFRMAEIHEDRGELGEAIAVYERFQGMYPLSLSRDDTQFHIMELQRALGDVDGMRASVAWLEREYPRSRFTRDAVALLDAALTGTAP